MKQVILFCLLISLNFSLSSKEKVINFEAISMVNMGPNDRHIVYDTYIIGDGSQSYTAPRWIKPFKMNRYETTYQLWYEVRIISQELGYNYKNKGEGGSKGKTGAEPTSLTRYQPVTLISWYDAMVWCNALSEIHGYKPCYTFNGQILKDSTDTAKCDLAECDFNADGFRLPTESEWEYAARKLPQGFMSGGLLSGQADKEGQVKYYEDEVAWTAMNSDSTHIVGTAGNKELEPSPATGNANIWGIYDMCGNVIEYCWDWFYPRYEDVDPGDKAVGKDFGSERVSRGGSWSPATMFCAAGDRYSYDPNEHTDYMGFRFVQTVK